jgi:hypothetical protein
MSNQKNNFFIILYKTYFSAGLDSNQQRFLVANSQAALQQMMNQQNAANLRNSPMGGAPLILSPRLQVPTSLAAANSLMNGSNPPPLISAGDASQLLYAQYAAAAEYANYSGLMSPLLAEYSTADPSGGLFAR